jgi:hypothetical protein
MGYLRSRDAGELLGIYPHFTDSHLTVLKVVMFSL